MISARQIPLGVIEETATAEVVLSSSSASSVSASGEKDDERSPRSSTTTGRNEPPDNGEHEKASTIDDDDVENPCPSCQRVPTRASNKSSCIDPGPPPDGGLRAWLQVLMGHLIVFNTWGFITSFGVFQTYYTESLGVRPSDVSWVGTVQIFLLFFVGTGSGRLTDAGFFHETIFAGSFLVVLGIFMTSLSTQYWQLFLAQGICTGLGNGLLFCPALSLISTYFSKHRAIAMAMAASGTASGGLVIPAMVQQLLPKIGFGWTMRAVGLVVLTTSVVANLLARTRVPPRRSGPMVDWAAFRELPYCLFAGAMFLIFWGLYFAFYYIGSFGRNVIGVTQNDSIDLLLIMNGVGLFGRLIPNYSADRWLGPLNALIPVVACAAVLIYCWLAVHTHAGLIAFATVYGMFAAGIQSLFPATISSLTQDVRKTGTRMGMVFSIVSFASLTGTPIAGILLQRDNGSYRYAQIFGASVMMCGCCVLIAARIVKTGFIFKARV
ncbi:MAG: hypothetical protein M1825_006490 [Sarcosagium campestre]|nr:MAG: hypothetical protein M1825_006490 [Sarcosagium campestre]